MRDRMLELVKEKHAHQTRNGSRKTPYWCHCLGAAEILEEALDAQGDIEDPTAVEILYLAALGHDLYEDTDVKHRQSDIIEVYGPEVHALIEAMTNEKSDQDRADYEDKLRNASDQVLLIKYADLIDNTESIVANREYFESGWVEDFFAPICEATYALLADHRFGAELAGAAAQLQERLDRARAQLLQ